MMKAIGYRESLPADNSKALEDIELPVPEAKGHNVLVKIKAISVNPVDTKIRKRVNPEGKEYKVLGWDACGVIESVGDQVTLFSPGDEVWYAGAIDRPGCNAEFHLVDERIVSSKPKSLDFDEAAALPLTSITAWELLFDRLGLNAESRGALLIIGAGGGVGSIMIQLAKKLTAVKVIATAGREETREWVRSLGADVVVDHTKSLAEEISAAGIENVQYIASLTNTDEHIDDIVSIIAPQGKVGLIDDPASMDIKPFKTKSVSLHWELMFTRSLFETDDMIEQHRLLGRVADMVDKGKIRTTLAQHFGSINAENLLRAHVLLESGKSRGKIVLSGF